MAETLSEVRRVPRGVSVEGRHLCNGTLRDGVNYYQKSVILPNSDLMICKLTT